MYIALWLFQKMKVLMVKPLSNRPLDLELASLEMKEQ